MSTRGLSAVILLASLVLGAQAPVSLAQEQAGTTSVDLSVPVLPRPVAPGTSEEFNVTVRYQWNNGFSNEPTEIRLEVVDEPPWLTSTFEPATVEISTQSESQVGNNSFQVAPRASGTETVSVNLNISIAPDAPAFGEGVAAYRVVAEENPPLQATENEVEFPVTAGFSGEIAVSLPKGDTVDANGGFVTKVPLHIENRGNGPLLLSVNVVRQPAEAKISAPLDVPLGVEEGQRVTTPELEVLVPWKVSEEGEVAVEIVPTHAQRGVRGQAQTVTFQLQGDSAIPVPGPGPLIVPAILAAALLLARRRHDL